MLELALLLAVLSPQAPTTEPTPDAAQEEALPPEPSLPRVVIETSSGSITVQLFPGDSPLAVQNFLEYVRSGHYEGTIFHRVMPDFMIQGGGYDAEMNEREPRGPIKNEARNGLRNERGHVGHGPHAQGPQRPRPVLLQPQDEPPTRLRDRRGGLHRVR